jgi:hypothetical protein
MEQDEGRERLERAKERHQDLPEDLVAAQVAKVEDAVHLLGDDPELAEAADAAIESNLERVKDALESGADHVIDPPDDESDANSAANPGNG